MTRIYRSWGHGLEGLFILLVRQAKLLFRFKLVFLFAVVSIFLSVVTYFYIGGVVDGGVSSVLSGYGSGDYFTYVLIGIATNSIVLASMTTYLRFIAGSFWSNKLDSVLLSSVGLRTFFLSGIVWSIIYSMITISIYVVFGLGLFGATITFPPGWWIVIPILFLASLALSGIGLISASVFFFRAAKGGSEPVNWIFTNVSGIFAGVYFPPTLLPVFVRNLSILFPHTYAIEGIRQVFMNGKDYLDIALQETVMYLFIYAAISLPAGIMLFRRCLRIAEREGTLVRWQ